MSKKQTIKKKVNHEAPNLFAERLEELKTMFPEVLTEGKIDFNTKLKTYMPNSMKFIEIKIYWINRTLIYISMI
jgi:hypothetical protein